MLNEQLAPATLPPGLRVYAVGDVHGCVERLAALHGQIAEDAARRPVGRAVLVHLGDYVDRGLDSAAVVQHLLGPPPAGMDAVVNLLGNHEAMMLAALPPPGAPAPAPAPAGGTPLAGPGRAGPQAGGRAEAQMGAQRGAQAEASAEIRALWLANGGRATLLSYDCDPAEPDTWQVPPAHVALLRGCALSWPAGGYLFAHAGVRPDVPLDRQSPDDLLWIREPFLSWGRPLPAVVVHGHTPEPQPSVRPHRIGIDTGAVFGGALTCLVLERDRLGFLVA
ncbi:metallophosphoesterase [Roseomonas sp. NAR14]|uniref:Metallophosphoesterase n=1 Tax=Roseomonas acroporae TaxID=2937791 RepID=A0A9X1YD53_9PROT|nr:metallophosphoesterase [Roseomonas acroporae]MCK8786815.1 metallophosphoesterase [Roseomonas acroporae]